MKAAVQTTWNKGRVVGKKPPLTPDQVSLIRMLLRQEKALRDLALFNVALDTCQRQSKIGPKGSAKCCHFEGGVMRVQPRASIRAAALVI